MHIDLLLEGLEPDARETSILVKDLLVVVRGEHASDQDLLALGGELDGVVDEGGGTAVEIAVRMVQVTADIGDWIGIAGTGGEKGESALKLAVQFGEPGLIFVEL